MSEKTNFVKAKILRDLHGATFLGSQMLQHWEDLALWEAFLARHEVKSFVELGSGASSYFFALQALQRGFEFRTFDREEKYLEAPVAGLLGLDGMHRRGDIFAETRRDVLDALESLPRPLLLFCDDGDKPREFASFVPGLKPGDLVAVHDWNDEFMPRDVELVEELVEPIFTEECEALDSITRFWRRVEPQGGTRVEPRTGRKLKVVITGTGRCGTRFVARFLTSAGLPCGWETFFTPAGLRHAYKMLDRYWMGLVAESSWQAAPFLDCAPLMDAFVVHLVRHPKQFIESLMRDWPGRGLTPHMRFAAKVHPQLNKYDHAGDRVTWIALHYALWNEMIERQTAGRDSAVFQIEREPLELLEILGQRGLIDVSRATSGQLFADRKCNTRGRPGQYDVSLNDISDNAVRERMLEVAARYGYEWD